MLKQYLATALWSSIDDSGTPLDLSYSIHDIDLESLKSQEKQLYDFIEKCGDLVDGLDWDQVAHDFWLTRNRHGAGFWDGDYEKELGQKLTDLAHEFKEIDIVVGDDGKLYFY